MNNTSPASPNPYYDENNNKLIRESLCVYLDILGFSNTITEAYVKGREDKLLKKITDAIEEDIKIFQPSFPDIIKKESLYFKIFTDNIVIGYPMRTWHGESEFGDLITLISFYQTSMALRGLFVRGAIVIGSLFMDDKIVFGDAILEAHELESKYSNVPRIILSEKVFELVKSHLKFYSDPKDSPQYEDILIDNDGYAFLNYLTNLDPEYIYWKEVRKHKKYVEFFLKKHLGFPRIWNKYFWIANYHNHFVKGYSKDSEFDKKYLINSALLISEPSKIVD